MRNISNKRSSVFLAVFLLAALIALPAASAGAASERPNYENRIAVGTSHALMIDNEGNVWSTESKGSSGDSEADESTVMPNMVYHNSQSGKAVSVAAGWQRSILLTEDGDILMWENGSTEISKQPVDKATAISAGHQIYMAILQTGTAWIWSYDLSMIPNYVRDASKNILSVKEISVGSNDMILLRDSAGKVYKYDLAKGYAVPVMRIPDPTPTLEPTLTPTPTPTDEPASSEDSSQDESIPDVSEPEPDLSINTETYLSSPASEEGTELTGAVSISAGSNFGAALMENGEVYTWGSSANGVLGHGNIKEDYYELARRVDGLKGIGIIAISAGKEHMIVLDSSGKFYGWGNSYHWRLDWRKENIILVPAELDLNIPVVALFECGDTYNLAFDSAGKFYTWGEEKMTSSDPRQIEFVQTLFKVKAPKITVDNIGDESLTVRWKTEDYNIGQMSGFQVAYRMPDGTLNKTMLLPVTMNQITLKDLQAETNYNISLQLHAKSGLIEETESVKITTLEDDDISPTPEPTITVGPESSGTEVSETSSSVSASSETSEDPGGIPGTLGMILVGLVFVVLIAAVVAIIFIWRRVDRNELSGVKPVRIIKDDVYDDLRVYGSPEDEDYVLVENPDTEIPLTGAGGVSWQNVGDEVSEDTEVHEIISEQDMPDNDGSGADENTDEEPAEIYDDYPVDERKIRDDKDRYDDDDFIVRRPGEPKK